MRDLNHGDETNRSRVPLHEEIDAFGLIVILGLTRAYIVRFAHQIRSVALSIFLYEQACKPGYVENDHLSRTAVTDSLKRPT